LKLSPEDTTVKTLITAAPYGVRRHVWTRAEYHRAVDAGLFAPEEHWELIAGELYETTHENSAQSHACLRARRRLEQVFAEAYCFLSGGDPISLAEDTEPEPDIAVVVGTAEQFAERHPTAADIRLVVEVAVTSADFDRLVKAPVYAAAGIAEYWILHIEARRLEVYRNPKDGAYTSTVTIPESGAVSPLAAPNAVIAVADLLP
jgi:Uma2 family endonuclease